jgi:hypothetical protein
LIWTHINVETIRWSYRLSAVVDYMYWSERAKAMESLDLKFADANLKTVFRQLAPQHIMSTDPCEDTTSPPFTVATVGSSIRFEALPSLPARNGFHPDV